MDLFSFLIGAATGIIVFLLLVYLVITKGLKPPRK